MGMPSGNNNNLSGGAVGTAPDRSGASGPELGSVELGTDTNPGGHDRPSVVHGGRMAFFVLLGSCAVFGLLFGYLSYMRFYTFGAGVNDLGFWNQVYWTSVHGGPREWVASSQQNFYSSYPLDSSTFLILVPAYWFAPSPSTLLFLQGIALSSTAIPAYFLARTYRLAPFVALGMGGLFLLNFQIQGAFLNDFHIESFFPALFLSAVLSRERHWNWPYIASAVLAGFVDPLALLVVTAFVLAKFYVEGHPPLRIGAGLLGLGRWLRSHYADAVVLGALVVMGTFLLLGGYVSAFHLGGTGATPVAPSGSATWWTSYDLDARLLFLCLTTAPFLGLMFIKRDSLITGVPLLAFLSVGSVSYFQIFGHQTAFLYVPVALWGLLLYARDRAAARRAERWARPSPLARDTTDLPTRTSNLKRMGRWARSPNTTAGLALAVTLVLFLAYSPVSPTNSHMAELSGLNEVPTSIINVTPADTFLHKALGLIPAGASVLTQNNIVQLTGRTTFVWAFPGNVIPNITTFDYVLADDSNNHFSQFWYGFISPYVTAAFESKQFGVLAFGFGITLLEKNYTNRPAMTEPVTFAAPFLPLASGYQSGSVYVHPAANNTAFWFGPYVALPPGNYVVNFTLEVSATTPAISPILQLAVYTTGPGGPTYFSQDPLTLGSFTAPDTWTPVTLNLTLTAFTPQVQCPGFWPTSAATVSLESISITLLS
jgi:uncharacterized membrane protein